MSLIVNWGGSEAVSAEEYCTYLGQLVGKPVSFRYDERAPWPICPDTTLMHEVLGRTQVNWRERMRRMVEARVLFERRSHPPSSLGVRPRVRRFEVRANDLLLMPSRGRCLPKMYDSYMTELPVSEARNRLAEAIEIARNGEPVYVTRRGRRVAVLVDADAYDALVESAEDLLDHAELAAARAEDEYVPWEEVKADLGLL